MCEGKNYVLLGDYYSKFVEFTELKENTTSKTVIEFMKEQFARHGIPEQLISDNGPQYDSEDFRRFAKDYGFQHLTSSPGFQQSNGYAESQVKVLKSIIKKTTKEKKTDLTKLSWNGGICPLTN